MAELALTTEGCAVTKTDELAALMRSYFCPPEWALFFEVYATTGTSSGGRTDAIAMNLYPSRGLLMHGFEMKVSRSDWLRELKEPAKAEEMFGYCDHWWLVVGDRSIVKDGELPEPWGLMAPRSNGMLAIATRAPKLKPKPLDRGMVASLARRANDMANESIDARVAKETAQFNKDLDAARQERDEARRHVHQGLAKRVEVFEKASGIRLDDWHGTEELGRAVKAVLEDGLESQRYRAQNALESITGIQRSLRALLETLPKKEKPVG